MEGGKLWIQITDCIFQGFNHSVPNWRKRAENLNVNLFLKLEQKKLEKEEQENNKE
jgi:hypothetical protein